MVAEGPPEPLKVVSREREKEKMGEIIREKDAVIEAYYEAARVH